MADIINDLEILKRRIERLNGFGEEAEVIDNVISLLKEREPRVLTLEEVKQAKGRDVWLELSGNIADDVLTAATIEGCGTKGLSTRYESLNYCHYCVKPYGWRCWSARPTDEQRKEAKWG